jgi:hypothetical protein
MLIVIAGVIPINVEVAAGEWLHKSLVKLDFFLYRKNFFLAPRSKLLAYFAYFERVFFFTSIQTCFVLKSCLKRIQHVDLMLKDKHIEFVLTLCRV